MPNDPEYAAKVLARLDDHLRLHPGYAERFYRELLMDLHRRGIVAIDTIHDDARVRLGRPSPDMVEEDNQAARDRWGERERQLVEAITREYVREHLSIADVDDLVNLALKREEVHGLENFVNRPNISFRELADKVQRFAELPLGETLLAPEEVVGTRVALIRHLISDQLEFIGIAKHHLRIRDFGDITRRVIGSDDGMGRIGGKAGGMTLAHCILAHADEGADPFLPVAIPESYYLRSDVVEDFLRLNRLDEYQSQKYKPIEDVAREYPLIRGVFRNGDFPWKVVDLLRDVLEKIGPHPLIVRSSSLLEDRFGTAFSGKYASYFLANQGTLEGRLRALLGAIAEVYASVLAPDPILYRREHDLIDYVEEMGVLIQKVVGFTHGDFFLPAFAGVAFSRNEYRWTPRIRCEDGLMRCVVGLGTLAVDRRGSDYPRMVALGEPTLRPESSVEEIMRRSQHTIDLIDLKNRRFRTVRRQELFTAAGDFPMHDKIVSIHGEGDLYRVPGLRVDAPPSQQYITFDKLLRDTPFAQRMRELLSRLEQCYGRPVDLEFACDGQKIYILQCRPLAQSTHTAPVAVPDDLPDEDVVFDAHRYVRTGLIEGLEYIVYVDPSVYDAVATRQRRLAIARLIGRINHALPRRSFALIGPGRWGSNDVRLGVQVHYADINRCRMLIEVARLKNGFQPEVSFGTHFFQDLVEENIDYLPLYPDEPGNRFNESFMTGTANALTEVLPDAAEFTGEVRIIHVPAVTAGRTLTIAMDGESDCAVAYLV